MKMQQNHAMITERHLFGFARSYFSEAFPNPDRQGCPSPETLRALAERPKRSEGSITSHLSVCSPCFNDYVVYLERARLRMQRVRRVQRIKFTVAAMIIVSLSCFVLMTRHRRPLIASRTGVGVAQSLSSVQLPGTATPVAVLIDLGNASPMRGAPDLAHAAAAKVIPSNPSLEMILKLPLGSEDRNYSIRLNSHGSAVWSVNAKPQFKHGHMLLHAHADFSRVLPGEYELEIVAKDFRISVPVFVHNVSPANIRKP